MKPGQHTGADLLTPIAPLPDYVVEGLAQLKTSPPALWPIDQLERWPTVVYRVTAFAWRWDGRARGAGWSDVSHYGLCPRAPWARVGAMGAAFLVALNRSRVTAVGADAIAIVTPTGARLRIYREPQAADSVLAWSLCPVAASNRL